MIEYTDKHIKVPKEYIDRIILSWNFIANRFTVVMYSEYMDPALVMTGYNDWTKKRATYKLDPEFPRVHFDDDNIYVQNAAQPGIADEIGIYTHFTTRQKRFKLVATFPTESELGDFISDLVDESFFVSMQKTMERDFGYAKYELYNK